MGTTLKSVFENYDKETMKLQREDIDATKTKIHERILKDVAESKIVLRKNKGGGGRNEGFVGTRAS